MCTTIDTVISLIVVYVIGLLCVALIGYRIGWWVGEITLDNCEMKLNS